MLRILVWGHPAAHVSENTRLKLYERSAGSAPVASEVMGGAQS